MKQASHQGFTHTEIVPYDIIHPRRRARLLRAVQSAGLHPRALRRSSAISAGRCYIWLVKPGVTRQRRRRQPGQRTQLFGRNVSIVVPCHNEEMNVRRLDRRAARSVRRLHPRDHHRRRQQHRRNGRRGRAAMPSRAARPARQRGRRRTASAGPARRLCGGHRALHPDDGLRLRAARARAARPVRRVAEGHDGAIGSRFSHESVLINYPVFQDPVQSRLPPAGQPDAAPRRPRRLQQPEAVPGGHPQDARDRGAPLRGQRRDRPEAVAGRLRHRGSADLVDQPHHGHGRRRRSASPGSPRATSGA